MSTHLSFDESRLIVVVPADREESAGQATQRVLENRPLRSSLRRAMRPGVCPYPNLNKVRVRISG
jgi:hypothetical protein